jgi:hypothetical protein
VIKGDGLLPLLALLMAVLALWTYMLGSNSLALPPNFGNKNVTGLFPVGRRFPPAPPMLTRSDIESRR